MAPASPMDVWDDGDGSGKEVTLDCLLPTGVLIQLHTRTDGLLSAIKEELWLKSKIYPLYSLLKDKNTYRFMCINQRAEKEELMDEEKRLCDVRPFQPMLKVIDKKGDKAETILNFQISSIIGKGLKEFDALKNTEVSDFRIRMKQMCRKVAKERDTKDWLERAKYLYPPDLANAPGIPKHIEKRLSARVINVDIQISGNGVSFPLQVPMDAMPLELMDLFLKTAHISGHTLREHTHYVLKVVGREEYLIGEHPLTQFNIIQSNLVKGKMTKLSLVERDTLFENERPKLHPRPNERCAPPPLKPRHSTMKGTCLWDLEDVYSITANMATNISLSNNAKVYLRAGIYHGPEMMCGSNCSKDALLTDHCAEWNELLTFEIQLINLPRMSRLCFALFAVYDKKHNKKDTPQRKVRKGKMDVVPLAWANIPVFDYVDVLRTGCLRLYMWPINDENVLSEELLNPIGSVECNPNAEEAICLELTCQDFNVTEPIFYPSLDRVAKVAQSLTDQKDVLYNDVARKLKKEQLDMLRSMIEADPLAELHDQEKEMIWRLRQECKLHFPDCLARLVSCVDWNNHVQVAFMQDLLKQWPKTMPPLRALELLDFNYADRAVRKFAVDCLSKISDLDLCQYLLQLVQVLKYESYIESHLVQFLLQRALRSQRVGHIFFWLLKSEMHVQSVSVRYGLILEAYCHGSIGHVKLLSKQVAALDKLASCCLNIKEENIANAAEKKATLEKMRKVLAQKSFFEVLSDIPSSLDPSYRLKGLRMDKCKFMDSKKRPLWLVWVNQDQDAPDVFMMYKKGDDLRQDMLTLQILRVIDSLWQEEGLDLCMNAYGCLATGHEEGLIEIVLESDTIANIQKRNALAMTAAFKKDSLWKWLHEHHKDTHSMDKAIEEFTLSCAGYCVATYVLGIGDRHNDNIMLKKNGQMFHIDFGHFLGNFKSKLGVRRERVPFVITNDFMYIIKRGPENSEQAMERFSKLCVDAFMILRRHSHFLLSLFMMMMNTGIPQLSSVNDILYLRNTLRPHDSEEVARVSFQEKFNEAIKGSWKPALNFTAHNIARDNT